MKTRRRRTATTTTAPTAGETAPGASSNGTEKKGPDRSQLPDGKRPHDAVTWADLIALELVDEPSGNTPDA